MLVMLEMLESSQVIVIEPGFVQLSQHCYSCSQLVDLASKNHS